MATFVLVHGSFQGGWIWKPTAEVLRSQGHTVYAPSLDGCGERSKLIRPGITIAAQGQEVADFLFYEDLKDIVLVGTSTGGLVICKIAELARERISRIAFVDALAPQPGERVSNIVQRGPNAPPIPTTGLTRGPTREEMENRHFATSSLSCGLGRLTALPRILSRHRTRPVSWTPSGRRSGRTRASFAAPSARTRRKRTSAAPPRRSTPTGTRWKPATTQCSATPMNWRGC